MLQRESTDKAFMYGSLYSTPGIVMYYLIRRAPGLLLRVQQTTFGPKDKYMLNLPATWGATYNQYDEVKELVPE